MNVERYRKVITRAAQVEILNHNFIKADTTATQEKCFDRLLLSARNEGRLWFQDFKMFCRGRGNYSSYEDSWPADSLIIRWFSPLCIIVILEFKLASNAFCLTSSAKYLGNIKFYPHLGVGTAKFQHGEVHELFFTVVIRVILFCELIEVHAFLLTVTIEVVLVAVLPRDVKFDGVEVGRLLVLLLAEDLERCGLCSKLGGCRTHVKVNVGWVMVRLDTYRQLGV